MASRPGADGLGGAPERAVTLLVTGELAREAPKLLAASGGAVVAVVVDGVEAASTQPLRKPPEAKRGHTDQGAKRLGLGAPAIGLACGAAPRRNSEPTLFILAGGWHNDYGAESRAARRRGG